MRTIAPKALDHNQLSFDWEAVTAPAMARRDGAGIGDEEEVSDGHNRRDRGGGASVLPGKIALIAYPDKELAP